MAISIASGFFAIGIKQFKIRILYYLIAYGTIKSMKALPALLTNSEEELTKQITMLSPFFTHYQIDITDGAFVPSKTLTIDAVARALHQIDPKIIQNFTFDFDLMVVDYKRAVNSLLNLQNTIKIANVFIHASALKHQPIPISDKFSIGLAIDHSDDIDDLYRQYNINTIPSIQIMTVVPGFQGSPFIEKELNKIERLRVNGYRYNIFLDGGVNDTTIPVILSHTYKPDYVGIGSFLSKAADIKQRVEYLKSVLG